jgi:hypothetical protein
VSLHRLLPRKRETAASSCRRLVAHALLALSYDLLVAFWDPVQPHHVRQAAAEYDQLGQDEFLARHHFGPATAYLLILDGKSYDSKAILGVAYQYATGRPLGPHDFSGGVYGRGAVGVLRALGFEIANIRDRLKTGLCLGPLRLTAQRIRGRSVARSRPARPACGPP